MTKQLKEGQYFGQLNHKVNFKGITITDTEYTHDYVDWHTHENPYFTFLLQGKLIEENKKESYTLSQGSLLFHNWQDFHRNIKPPEFTRGAHIEINKNWTNSIDFNLNDIEGSINIENPTIKNLVIKVLLESKKEDNYNQTSIELLLIELLSNIKNDNIREGARKPQWSKKLKELIHENQDEKITLEQISLELNLHPVYLSRTFHKYYGITFGQYCREIRLNKAINAVISKKHNLTDVAYLTHYYDQSHMIGDFKNNLKVTPSELIKIIG